MPELAGAWDQRPAQTPAQIKAALWSDPRHHVFAVLDGAAVPDLPARLGEADVADHDCLVPGALSASERARAPYLAQLKVESAFTDWLLFQARTGLGPWGLLAQSRESQLTVRNHLRTLSRAVLPDGLIIDLAWMDHEVLEILLQGFDAQGLRRLFGPLESLLVADEGSFASYQLLGTGLQRVRSPVLGVAA